MKRLIALIAISVALLGFMYLYSNEVWLLPPEVFNLVHGMMFLIMIGTLTLLYFFHQSRLFYIMLLFLGTAMNAEFFDYLRHTDALFKARADGGNFTDAYIMLVFPIFIVMMALAKERSFFGFGGWMRLGVTLIVILLLDLFVFVPVLSPFGFGCEACGFVLLPQYLPLWVSTSIIFVPLIVLLGAVVVRNSTIEGVYFLAFLAAHLAALSTRTLDVFILFATAYAIIAAIFILTHSYTIAFIDELTGIKGRRAMQIMLATLHEGYTLVMCDIDHFKTFNDTHGHDVGDEVLKLVATELNRVGGGGRAFRWGGEEFVIIFNGATSKEAKPYVEAVRKAIEVRPFLLRSPQRPKAIDPEELPQKRHAKPPVQTQKLHVTVSFGMAQGDGKVPYEEVMKAADTALYAAKKAGRNCVRP